MGLIDLFKGELVEIIDWTDETRDTLVHKFPSAAAHIKYGAQLTVRESQAAIFINEGKIADVFGPGRFTLTTENLPVLSRLKGWMHGFKSPFLVDVYFVSTRQFAGMKWGTPNPIILRDPELKQVRVRAFGSYSIRITDPAVFFREQAGTKSTLSLGECA